MMRIKKKHVKQIHEALSEAFWATDTKGDYLVPTGSDTWLVVNEALELITQYKLGRI